MQPLTGTIEERCQRLRNQPALTLKRADDEITLFAIRDLELTVEKYRQRHENADQRNHLERQRSCQSPDAARPLPSTLYLHCAGEAGGPVGRQSERGESG